MLASAAAHFKDRRIYATGGNDNTVGIWDLTEFSLNQDEMPPNQQRYAKPVHRFKDTNKIQMNWSIAWPNLLPSRPSQLARSPEESATRVQPSFVDIATI